MDFGRIVQMIINQLVRRAVNTGIDAAVSRMAPRGGAADPEDAAQAKAARQAAKRARQAINIGRKL